MGGGKFSGDPFSALDNAMRQIDGEVKYSDVQGWIGEHTTKTGDYTGYAIRQLANIYMFIRNYNAKGLKSGKKRSTSGRFLSLLKGGMVLPSDIIELTAVSMNPLGNPAYKLVVEENEKLCEFWKEVIAEYLGIDFKKMI